MESNTRNNKHLNKLVFRRRIQEMQGNIKVRELSIENWRGIKKTRKPIKLKKINILVGRNNTGKTAILEALALLPYPHKMLGYLGNSSILNYIIKYHWSTKSLVYRYHGRASITYVIEEEDIGNILYRIEYDSGSNNIMALYNILGFDNVFFPGVVVDNTTRKIKRKGMIKTDRDLMKLFGTKFEVLLLYASSNLYESLASFFDNPDNWSVIESRGAHTRVVEEIINPTVDDEYTEVHLGKRGIEIRRRDARWIHVRDLGSGVQRVLLTALIIEYVDPDIVLIDDFEVALHPALMKNFLKYLVRRGCQVVLTTHSRDTIELFDEIDVPADEGQVIVLYKDSNDIVRARYIDTSELHEILESGIDIRKALNLLEPE